MPTILRWIDTAPNSTERAIAELMSTLDPRWYPRNIIKGNLYDIFEMYGEEIATTNQEITQVFNDLYVDTVRIPPVDDSGISKMFDNFGALVGVSKIFSQQYDAYDATNVWQGYRSALALFIRSYLWGSTERALSLIGGAFDGMAPIVVSPLSGAYGWKLTTITGSVLNQFPGYIITTPMGRYGNIFYVGEGRQTVYPVGTPIALSFSKLGNTGSIPPRQGNALLKAEDWFYGGDEIHFFGKSESIASPGVRTLIEGTTKKILPGRVTPRFRYHYDYAYYRPTESVGQFTDFLAVQSPRQYVFNTQETAPRGTIYDTGIVTLPSNYQSLDWYYDWLAFELNNGSIQMELRSYNTASIPITVPFYKFDPAPVPTLGRTSARAHWLFQTTQSVQHNTVHATFGYNHLTSSIGPVTGVDLARDNARTGQRGPAGGFNYRVPSNRQSMLDPSGSFSLEVWVKGVDRSYTGQNLLFQRTGSHRGWGLKINPVAKNVVFFVKSGSVLTSTTGSLTSMMGEEPEYWHRFAASYLTGEGLYIYEDELLLSQLSVNVTLPTDAESTNFAEAILTGGDTLLLDEVIIRSGHLTEPDNYGRWSATRPHVFVPGVPSGSVKKYYQARVRMYATSSQEIQFHQFSMRGLSSLAIVSPAGIRTVAPTRLPLFPTISIV